MLKTISTVIAEYSSMNLYSNRHAFELTTHSVFNFVESEFNAYIYYCQITITLIYVIIKHSLIVKFHF